MFRRELQPAVPISNRNHGSGLAMAGPAHHFISNGVDWQMGLFSGRLSAESNK